MTELSFSNTKKNDELSTHLFSNLFNFCFSIFSHPLYFSYFLFFSPYFFKLLSFLSPLFITTTLLFVALLTTFTPNLAPQEKGSSPSFSSDSKYGFPLSVLQTLLSWLLSKADEKDEELGYLDELEAYLVMFQASIFEAFETKSVENCSEVFEEPNTEFSDEGKEDFCSTEELNNIAYSVATPVQKDCSEVFEEPYAEFSDEGKEDFCSSQEANIVNSVENPVQKVDDNLEDTKAIAEVKSLGSLFQENAELLLEDMSCPKKDKEAKLLDPESNKVEESKEKWPLRSGSKVKGYRDMYATNKVSSVNSGGEYAAAAVKVKSQRLEANYIGSPESNWEYSGRVTNHQSLCSPNLGSFGSMRVEKEWRRTLACKLFEERHNNADESGGMDMLWETYETESNKVLKKSNTKKGKKKGEVVHEYKEDEDEEEEDYEGKLCCLQALKFSAGKMNLGMGRPNLLKFSKALKGIGWLHHVGKNGKKGNH
ncbi:hypothetical protein RIF29_29536 [Crotalaria pallida]|uniref:Uncharacterized protein n=1 Tax=Crotalaria pallida TaxID=3830 RepID=A0AAN9HW00_CROPI